MSRASSTKQPRALEGGAGLPWRYVQMAYGWPFVGGPGVDAKALRILCRREPWCDAVPLLGPH